MSIRSGSTETNGPFKIRQEARLRLAPARRYVIPRWDDVFALDENPAFTAAEPDSLMTRAMGLSMLRTDGEDHQRQRRAAHRVLRTKDSRLTCLGCWRAFQTS